MSKKRDSMGRESPLFANEPNDTKRAILTATFDALAESGYANLTVNRICRHFSKSEGLIFYHYNEKNDIVLDVLHHLLESVNQYPANISDESDPETQLKSLFEQVLFETNERCCQDYERVLIELRTQAAQNEVYRDCFNRFQETLHEQIQDIVRDGISSGQFKKVDANLVADFLITLVSGSRFGRVTTRECRSIRLEINNYIESRLLMNKNYG